MLFKMRAPWISGDLHHRYCSMSTAWWFDLYQFISPHNAHNLKVTGEDGTSIMMHTHGPTGISGFELDGVISGAAGFKEYRPLARGQHLYLQGDDCKLIYVVLEGVLKSYETTASGDEYIARFHFPNDLVGAESYLDKSAYSVIALERSLVCSLSLGCHGSMLADAGKQVDMELHMLSHLIRQEEKQLKLMRHSCADSLVAALLLEICRHQCHCNGTPCNVRLPMSQREIAIHLGLAYETVSRTLHKLSSQGVVAKYGREWRLLDRSKLEALVMQSL